MTIAKPYPSDPSMRATRVGDAPALPVTDPVQAPGGDPAPNSVRSREEGLGVKPAVIEANLEALAELAAADADGGVPEDGSGPDVHPEESAEAEAERQKREKRNARRREQRAAKAKKAPAKKATKK